LATIELAWRARWLGERLRSSASVFHTDWRDRTSIDGTIGAEIVEPIETRILGAELELEAELGEAWALRGGLGWLDSEYTRGRYALNAVPYDLRGRKAADAPRATAVLGAIWRGPQGWYASADAYHAARAESSTFLNTNAFPSDSPNAPPPPREAYTVLDLRLGWRRDDLNITLTVGNVLDENYIDRYVERRPASRRIGEPRQVDLSVGWDW
jgi:iron complex outermembrane recepter protein